MRRLRAPAAAPLPHWGGAGPRAAGRCEPATRGAAARALAPGPGRAGARLGQAAPRLCGLASAHPGRFASAAAPAIAQRQWLGGAWPAAANHRRGHMFFYHRLGAEKQEQRQPLVSIGGQLGQQRIYHCQPLALPQGTQQHGLRFAREAAKCLLGLLIGAGFGHQAEGQAAQQPRRVGERRQCVLPIGAAVTRQQPQLALVEAGGGGERLQHGR
nr:hypothetical protein [Tanacetum cinerariifolium]